MTTVMLHTDHECAPHAIRTVAMAFAIALNLVALLIALRPLPLISIVVPLAPTILRAKMLQETPPIPPLPILRPVHHVVHAAPVIPSVRHPVSLPIPTTPTPIDITEPSTHPLPVIVPSQPSVTTGNSDATIAYETATPPDYPIVALRDGVEGTVLLRVLVDATGKPVQVLIDRSSGSRALDQAAREHVLAAWRFHPAQRDGHAVAAWAQVPVKFSLSNR